MCELVVESSEPIEWSRLDGNPSLKTFTVLNTRLDLRLITKKRFPNLQHLTFKPYGPNGRFYKTSDLPKLSSITRIDLVNMEPENEITVKMVRPLSLFPNLKVIGVLNGWSMPVQQILCVWSFLLKRNVHFRYTCRDYDFSDGKVHWFTERISELYI